MFKIQDGRSSFYQWDLNRHLIVEDESIEQVHYCNRTGEYSLVCPVFEQEGVRLAAVPNILLQSDWDINVYGYDKEYTKHSVLFRVIARTKPEDYVYTEEELKVWDELLQRVIYLEENGVPEEAVTKGIEAYFAANPIKAGATEEEAAQIEKNRLDIAELQEKEPDLSEYAKKSEIPDTSLFVTGQYVQTAIDASLPDLSPYAKRSEIPDVSDFISEIPAEYITETELTAKGYLTEHQSLDGYATEQYVQDAIDAIEIPESGEVELPKVIKNIEYKFAFSDSDTETPAHNEWYDAIYKLRDAGKSGKYLWMQMIKIYTDEDTRYGSFYVSPYEVISSEDLVEYAKVTDLPDVSGFQTEEQVIALIGQYGGGGGSLPSSEEGEF